MSLANSDRLSKEAIPAKSKIGIGLAQKKAPKTNGIRPIAVRTLDFTIR